MTGAPPPDGGGEDPAATGARSTLPFRSPPEAVFDVLADGRRYADWVVGAKRVRAVDDTWPEPGSRFHHEVGVGPLTLKDSSTLLALKPPRQVVLEVRAWPAGKARVTITVSPGEGGGSEVLLEEVPTDGLAKTVDSWPLRRLTMLRNVESLKRLRRIADGSGSTGG
jgi:uncharacterized protein YndB with AHSA1/START domain